MCREDKLVTGDAIKLFKNSVQCSLPFGMKMKFRFVDRNKPVAHLQREYPKNEIQYLLLARAGACYVKRPIVVFQ